jgi:hypothetical protein
MRVDDDDRAPLYRKPRGVAQQNFGIRTARAEQWRPIPGFDYEVSSHARVRRRSTVRGKAPKVLRPWLICGRYPCVSLRRNGKTFKRLAHRLYAAAFLGLSADQEIDHRRVRVSTRRAIIRALPGKPNHSSRFKGVSYDARGKKFFACIKINGRTKALGNFADEISAAKAYDAAARKHLGRERLFKFSGTNLPNRQSETLNREVTRHARTRPRPT